MQLPAPDRLTDEQLADELHILTGALSSAPLTSMQLSSRKADIQLELKRRGLPHE